MSPPPPDFGGKVHLKQHYKLVSPNIESRTVGENPLLAFSVVSKTSIIHKTRVCTCISSFPRFRKYGPQWGTVRGRDNLDLYASKVFTPGGGITRRGTYGPGSRI